MSKHRYHSAVIRVTKSYAVDVVKLREDPGDGTEAGWYAIVRTGLGADLWAGPHATREAAIRGARAAIREKL